MENNEENETPNLKITIPFHEYNVLRQIAENVRDAIESSAKRIEEAYKDRINYLERIVSQQEEKLNNLRK